MPFRNLLSLAFKDFFARKGRLFLSILGIVCGVASLLVLLSLIGSVKRTVKGELIGKIPITEMMVQPKGERVLFMVVVSYSSFDDSLVEYIEGLPGVDVVYPMQSLDIPAEIEGRVQIKSYLPTIKFHTDIAVFGVPREIIEDGLIDPEKYVFDPEAEKVPIVISKKMIELYNIGYAKTMNLGRIHEEALIGQEFELRFGNDKEFRKQLKKKGLWKEKYGLSPEKCSIVGASKSAPLMGISVPLEYVQYWREKFWKGDIDKLGVETTYEYLVVRARSIEYVESIRKKIEAKERTLVREVRAVEKGRIIEVLAMEGDYVEVNDPLFRIEVLPETEPDDAAGEKEGRKIEIFGSPREGVFYPGEELGLKPFVNAGDEFAEDDVLAIIKETKPWLTVKTQKDTLQKINSVSLIMSVVFGIFGIIILVISAISIFNILTMSVNEEKVDIGILRSVGARKLHIRLIYMLKAGLIGVIGGFTGTILGFIVMKIGDMILVNYFKDLPFSPESFFAAKWWLVVGCFFVGFFFSVLAGIGPANHAARMKPSVVLRQG